MSKPLPNRPLNPRRIAVLAINTFTQLLRMKVFYFLAFFGIIVIGANFLDLPTNRAPESAGSQVLYAIKNTSIGCMSLFSLVLSIVATGLLLPKDVEDRTLYTILAKPVPRLDYLLGKLLGVLALIFVSLLIMDLLMTGVIALRTETVVADQLHLLNSRGFPQQMSDRIIAETRALGPSWNLQAAVLVVFFRAVVMASVALLLSTFSTSTLFTAIVGFLVLFIGFFQADAREWYFADPGIANRIGSGLMTILLPDLQIYNVIDSIIEGKILGALNLLKLAGATAIYFVIYTFCSWIIFARKEF